MSPDQDSSESALNEAFERFGVSPAEKLRQDIRTNAQEIEQLAEEQRRYLAPKELVWKAMATGVVTVIVIIVAVATLMTNVIRLSDDRQIEDVRVENGDYEGSPQEKTASEGDP